MELVLQMKKKNKKKNKKKKKKTKKKKKKKTTIVGIFIFISRENFMLSWVEHEKRFMSSGPGPEHSII